MLASVLLDGHTHLIVGCARDQAGAPNRTAVYIYATDVHQLLQALVCDHIAMGRACAITDKHDGPCSSIYLWEKHVQPQTKMMVLAPVTS